MKSSCSLPRYKESRPLPIVSSRESRSAAGADLGANGWYSKRSSSLGDLSPQSAPGVLAKDISPGRRQPSAQEGMRKSPPLGQRQVAHLQSSSHLGDSQASAWSVQTSSGGFQRVSTEMDRHMSSSSKSHPDCRSRTVGATAALGGRLRDNRLSPLRPWQQATARMGPQSALEKDKLFQQSLQIKWKQEYDEMEDPNRASDEAKRRLFRMPTDPRSAITVAEHLVPHCLRDIEVLRFEMEHSTPQALNSDGLELNTSQTLQLELLLQVYSRVSHPSLSAAPERIFRPTFCRFLIDSGLVCPNIAGALAPVQYHHAVRLFDRMARHSRGIEGMSPSVTIDDAIRLIAGFLVPSRMPVAASSTFFDQGLEDGKQLMQGMLDKAQEHALKRVEAQGEGAEKAKKKHRQGCFAEHGAPPVDFPGSLQDWSSGLEQWSNIIGDNTSPDAIKNQCEQQSAIEGYLGDMVIEPDVVYIAEASIGLFRTIFDIYADEQRQQWSGAQATTIKHLSYAAFFRFCVDFGVFPMLCSFDYAKEAYRDSESLEDLGSAPPEPPPQLDVAQPSAFKFKQAVRDVSTGIRSIKSWSGGRRNSCPAQMLEKQLEKLRVEKPVIEPDKHVDISWVKIGFGAMSKDRRSCYALLRAIGDCVADRFQCVQGLFASVGDVAESDDANQPGKEVDPPAILSALRKLNVKHIWLEVDIRQFIGIIVPGASDTIRVADLEKAVLIVREDADSRFRPKRSPIVEGWSSSDSSNSFVLSPSGNLALGDEARRLDNEASWLCKPGETNRTFAFGAAAFLESLLRIALRYLHSTGVVSQMTMPGGPKALWLITYLHQRFNHELSLQRKTVKLSPISKDLTRLGTPPDDCKGTSPANGQNNLHQPLLASPTNLVNGTPAFDRPETPPTGATYSTKQAVLLNMHPDLFEGLPWTPTASERVGGSSCNECGRGKGANCIGSMFCHVCSGVDNMRLKDCILWPVMRRQRLRRDSLMEDEDDKQEDNSSELGSEAASSTTWGADSEATESRQPSKQSKASKSSAPGTCGAASALDMPAAAAARRVSRRKSVA